MDMGTNKECDTSTVKRFANLTEASYCLFTVS